MNLSRRPLSRNASVRFLSAISFLVGIVLPAAAQGLLHGIVTDAASDQPLSDVLVAAGPSGARSISDRLGTYTLVLPPGSHTLRWSRVGYKARSAALVIHENDSLRYDIRLTPSTTLLGEVSVTGERTPLSSVQGLGALSVSPARTERLGGAFADQLRMVQTLVGVTSNNEMSSRFNVRGGSGTENLLILNGTPVLEPFHLKESPLTGLSTINIDLLKKVLFIPGGFTARYGDRLSAVLDMEYREGGTEQAARTADASLATLGLTMEGPLDSSVSGLLSARTNYSRYVSNYLPSGSSRDPSFYDLQGTLSADLLPALHTFAFVLYSRDRTSGLATGRYGSTLVSFRGDLALGDRTILHAAASSYNDFQTLSWNPPRDLGGPLVANNDLSVTQRTAGITLESEFCDIYSLQAGVNLRESAMDERQQEMSTTPPIAGSVAGTLITPLAELRLKASPVLLSGFAENLLHVGPNLLVNAGIRVDHNNLPRETKISPRLLAAYRFASGTTLKASWGVYYQTANDQQLLSAVRAGLPPEHMQQAVHYVIGIEQPLKKDLGLRVDLFHKDLDNLISYERLASGEIAYAPRNDAFGTIDGLDIEASFNDARVFGWVNAAFLIAKQNNRFDTLGRRFLPTDQAKTVTVVFEYRFNEHLTANLRALYGSGFAYGTNVPGVPDSRGHYPDYKRADVRIQYAHSIENLRGMIYLEIMNLFAFQNVQSFRQPAGPSPPVPEFNLLLPMVANVGIKVWF